jgi:Sulfotransferase domain
MQNSVGVVFSWWRWRYVAWADNDMAGPLWRLVGVSLTNLCWGGGDYSENSKAAQHYLEHNELVRKVCPPERLLDFKLGSDWKPLCEFLDKEVPDVPYPNVNDKAMFVMFHKAILDRATVWAVRKVLVCAVPTGILAGAVWCWQRLRL